eukprot:764615-Hanusia_phi.AAC.1
MLTSSPTTPMESETLTRLCSSMRTVIRVGVPDTIGQELSCLGEPALDRFVYVDEATCIGCTNCATVNEEEQTKGSEEKNPLQVARSTFFMEQSYGRARAFRQVRLGHCELDFALLPSSNLSTSSRTCISRNLALLPRLVLWFLCWMPDISWSGRG